MLRSLLTVFAAIALLPDEGQWLPTQVREMDWEALQARGMEMTKDEFWHPEEGGVLSATVQINGCTASFVSKEGLLVTNHHCGFGAVSALSTPEANHLRDGFTAATLAQELPAPGMVATVPLKTCDGCSAKTCSSVQPLTSLARTSAAPVATTAGSGTPRATHATSTPRPF